MREFSYSVSGVSVNLDVELAKLLGWLAWLERVARSLRLCSAYTAHSGQILLEGKQLRIRWPEEAVANGISYVPEDRRRHGVILEIALAANVTMAIHRTLFLVAGFGSAPKCHLGLHAQAGN